MYKEDDLESKYKISKQAYDTLKGIYRKVIEDCNVSPDYTTWGKPTDNEIEQYIYFSKKAFLAIFPFCQRSAYGFSIGTGKYEYRAFVPECAIDKMVGDINARFKDYNKPLASGKMLMNGLTGFKELAARVQYMADHPTGAAGIVNGAGTDRLGRETIEFIIIDDKGQCQSTPTVEEMAEIREIMKGRPISSRDIDMSKRPEILAALVDERTSSKKITQILQQINEHGTDCTKWIID